MKDRFRKRRLNLNASIPEPSFFIKLIGHKGSKRRKTVMKYHKYILNNPKLPLLGEGLFDDMESIIPRIDKGENTNDFE